MEEHGLDNTICSHYMSGFERASQFLGRHIRPCVAVVGMPRRGILVQARSGSFQHWAARRTESNWRGPG